MKGRESRRTKSKLHGDGILIRISILAVSVVLLYLIFINREELRNLSEYGYLGIFIVNFISASTVFLPLPGTASVFVAGSVWDPFMVGIISGLGSSIGELFAYFLGYGGRGLMKKVTDKKTWITNLEKNFNRSGFRTTFIFAILPLPIFDIIGIIAGAVNYPLWKFFAAMVSARTIRNTVFALTGAKFLP